jgi:hypothetical protein
VLMRLRTLVALMVFSLPLTGCMQSLAGCEEGYSEMHAGDYVESAMAVDSNGKLTVQFESEDSPGFLEASEEYQTDPNIYVTLYVEFDDGSQTSVAFRQSGWDNFGDGAGGSSWGTHLTYNSPDGFCDGGCKRVKLGTNMEYGVLYYNGTCDSSPWIDID